MSVRLILLVLTGLLLGQPAYAMDRWAALSMIESGDNDQAVGPGGEVSRFQIRRELWTGGNPKDAHDALSAAREIMQPRLEEFQRAVAGGPSQCRRHRTGAAVCKPCPELKLLADS